MGRKFVPKPRQHVHRRAIPYAYPGAVRGQEEVPLDPDVVLGDLGGAGVSDFMTALRKNCYTPKKARSAAQALVDKMKREALRNPKYQRSASLPASAGARRIDLKLPASSHQGFRSPVKIEPRDEPLRAINQYAPIKREPPIIRGYRAATPTQWMRHQVRQVPNWNVRMSPISPVKIEKADGVSYGPAPSRRPHTPGQPYQLPALERESNSMQDKFPRNRPQNWS